MVYIYILTEMRPPLHHSAKFSYPTLLLVIIVITIVIIEELTKYTCGIPVIEEAQIQG